VAPAPAPAAPRPAAPAPAAGTLSAADYAARLVADVNAERRSRGLAALAVASCPGGFADSQAQRMAAARAIFHQDLNPVLDRCGGSKAAENVGRTAGSPEQLVQAWMASSGHRANILDPALRTVGCGAAQGSDGYWYASQVFLG
jgi:uncharacterized protein YkwD